MLPLCVAVGSDAEFGADPPGASTISYGSSSVDHVNESSSSISEADADPANAAAANKAITTAEAPSANRRQTLPSPRFTVMAVA